jgi:hypothetical protein
VVTTAVASRVVVAGPLAPFVRGFLEELDRCRYKSSAQYSQMLVMARLSRWLAGEGLGASDLTPAVLGRLSLSSGRAGIGIRGRCGGSERCSAICAGWARCPYPRSRRFRRLRRRRRSCWIATGGI